MATPLLFTILVLRAVVERSVCDSDSFSTTTTNANNNSLPAIINIQKFSTNFENAQSSGDLFRLQITGKRMTKNEPCLIKQSRPSTLPRFSEENVGNNSAQIFTISKTPLSNIRRRSSWRSSSDQIQVPKFLAHKKCPSEEQDLEKIAFKSEKTFNIEENEEDEGDEKTLNTVSSPHHEVSLNEENTEAELEKKSAEKQRKENVCKYEIQQNKLILSGKDCTTLIYRRWTSAIINEVDTIIFLFVDFREISSHFEKLSSVFHNLMNLEFYNTNINSLRQISLISLTGYLHTLTISEKDNPITNHTLWRLYTIFKINSLKWLNGMQVTVEEVNKSGQIFKGLQRLDKSPIKLQSCHLKTQQIHKANSEQYEDEDEIPNVNCEKLSFKKAATIVSKKGEHKQLMDQVHKDLSKALKAHNLFNYHWPNIFQEIVRDAVLEFNNMDEHMKMCTDKFAMAKYCDQNNLSLYKLPINPSK